MTINAPTHLAGHVVPVESEDDLIRSYELRSAGGFSLFSLRYAGGLEDLEGQQLIVAGPQGEPPLVVAVAADGEEIVLFDGADPGYAAGFADDDLMASDQEDDDAADAQSDEAGTDKSDTNESDTDESHTDESDSDGPDATDGDTDSKVEDEEAIDVDAQEGDAVSMLLEVRQATNDYALATGERTFRIRLDFEDGIDWEEFVESAGGAAEGAGETVQLASGETVTLEELQRDGYVSVSIVAIAADDEEYIVLDEDLTS